MPDLLPYATAAMPAALFVRALFLTVRTLRQPRHGLADFVWVGYFLLVGSWAASWLAANLSALGSAQGMATHRTELNFSSGPYLFAVLLLLLEARGILRVLLRLLKKAGRRASSKRP